MFIVAAILLWGVLLLLALGLCKCGADGESEEPAWWDDPEYEAERLDWDWPIAS